MSRNARNGILAVLILAAVAIPHNLPPELKDPYESQLRGWLITLWALWGIALLVLAIGCKFGPELDYDKSAWLDEIIHWKHFPKNWREILLVLLFFAGVALLFILTIAYISAYGEPG